MNKKTYATPFIMVTAIEVQSIMAGSPNDISDNSIVVDTNNPNVEEISGDEVMSKADIFIWE